jgi:16S rRNA (guanine1207-N2)-methyltransferase
VKSSRPPRSSQETQHYFTHRPSGTNLPKGSPKTRSIEVQRRGVTLQLTSGAGVFSIGALDEGSALLIDTAQWNHDARVLDLGCGWGAVGCFVARLSPQARVGLCDINLRATELSRENIRANGLKNAAAWCGDGASATRDDWFNVVLCNPPVRAGNAVIAQLFEDAHRALKTGGTLWVVLRTAQGAKSWARRLEESWGNCETVTIEQGYRILRSVK